VAFIVVFALFLVAVIVLAVVIIRWAVRRDRQLRASQGSDQLTE